MLPNLVFIISIYVITRYVSFMINDQTKWILHLFSVIGIIATVFLAYEVGVAATSQSNQYSIQ